MKIKIQSSIGEIDLDLGKDVIRVVRCKDCGHFEQHETYCQCNMTLLGTAPDAYCSYGERRAGASNELP